MSDQDDTDLDDPYLWPRIGSMPFAEVRPGDYVPGPGRVVDVDPLGRKITFASGDTMTFDKLNWLSRYGFEGVRRRFTIEEEPVSMTMGEFRVYCEPLQWQGHYVYIRSMKSVGYVSGSRQNGGYPESNTVTVVLVEGNGRYIPNSPKVIYSMVEAKEDLVPDVRYLVIEEREVTDV